MSMQKRTVTLTNVYRGLFYSKKNPDWLIAISYVIYLRASHYLDDYIQFICKIITVLINKPSAHVMPNCWYNQISSVQVDYPLIKCAFVSELCIPFFKYLTPSNKGICKSNCTTCISRLTVLLGNFVQQVY